MTTLDQIETTPRVALRGDSSVPVTREDLNEIHPFRVNVPEAELTELRRRINATRWSERETVTDASQGVQLATIQKLARYWATEYDWRKIEAKLNAVPQFITEIDGLDIHFIHVRSKHENALPLIVTHGWPSSIIHQLKIVDPLTNPTAHGASAADAFHLVMPSLPGYGYSGKPATPGWDPARIARAWVVLMKRVYHPGRCPRQHHALLADKHCDFFGPSLLGEQAHVFQSQRRLSPGGRERLS